MSKQPPIITRKADGIFQDFVSKIESDNVPAEKSLRRKTIKSTENLRLDRQSNTIDGQNYHIQANYEAKNKDIRNKAPKSLSVVIVKVDEKYTDEAVQEAFNWSYQNNSKPTTPVTTPVVEKKNPFDFVDKFFGFLEEEENVFGFLFENFNNHDHKKK
ncbi:hypothetical protein C1645_735542 [Glomus cerebriforme]|uniref:Uncharacterized protein n=1 Tax=Glomus cerebriforme TaxID=658196 RepID=A0A397T573_9GLOM|nr:hypothetical protein C1645_735542 [Glomus cerebriforme]